MLEIAGKIFKNTGNILEIQKIYQKYRDNTRNTGDNTRYTGKILEIQGKYQKFWENTRNTGTILDIQEKYQKNRNYTKNTNPLYYYLNRSLTGGVGEDKNSFPGSG